MATTAVLDIRIPFSTRHQDWTGRLQLNGWDSALNRRYADALIAELQANADEFSDVEIAAIRLGGGHASHLGGECLWSVVRTARSLYHVAEGAPLSMRCSAADFSGASMPMFRRCGATRFDLEMLSLSSTAFNRVNETDSLELYPILCNSFLHSHANDALGLVLLVGSPKASDLEVRRSFLEARHYHTAHVIIERFGEGAGTTGTQTEAGAAGSAGDARVAGAMEETAGSAEAAEASARCEAQIADAREVLGAAGFREYAPLRFARPGCEDPVIAAWHGGGDVIGIGLGARTRFAGALSTNTTDVETYLGFSHDFTKITASVEAVGTEAAQA